MSGSDQAKDKAKQKIGEAEEKLGEALGDEDIENTGKRDQLEGEVKETGHELRDKAAGAIHDLKEDREDE